MNRKSADAREAGSLASVGAMIQCSTATGSSVGGRLSTLDRLDLQEADERLAAAAATEETEQSKDDDHNQDDHKNAEDATSFSRSRSVG
jgi:hypothetical protein